MSRHEGVSCDSCLKSNFRGRRYKCLICYDYDLCASCYEDGVTSTRHSTDHPMQCILTRADFDLFYAGEQYGTEQPQSFTCPYCKRMGFSDAALVEHVSAEHIDTGLEVVCPVCAALPGGDPNLITDDFAGHLSLEHRAQARGDLISFLVHDEPSSIRHGGVRRMPHPGNAGRALGGPRSRRSNMHFSSAGQLSSMSPAGAGAVGGAVAGGASGGGVGVSGIGGGAGGGGGGRDNVDPISELLSQLTGVRRGAPQPSQLQQLQMQIQLERQQVAAARQNLERLPRRQAHPATSTSNASVIGAGGATLAAVVAGGGAAVAGSSLAQAQQQAAVVSASALGGRGEISITSNPLQMAAGSTSSAAGAGAAAQSQFLLTRFMAPTVPEAERTEMERTRADRSQFVQSLLLSTLSNLHIGELSPEPDEEEAADHQRPSTVDAASNTVHEVLLDDAGYAVDHRNEAITAAEQLQLQQQQQQLANDYDCDEMPTQQQQQQRYAGAQHYASRHRHDAAKLKSATAGSQQQQQSGKPPPPAQARAASQTASRPAPAQQQQQKSRELKTSASGTAVAAKETHDSSR